MGSELRTSRHERLLAAMVEVAGCEGYSSATVARVLACSGVSRATFYQHFRDLDHCFAEAYGQTVSGLWPELDRLLGVAVVEQPTREAISTLLRAAERAPAPARLLAMEAFAGPADVRAEHHRLLAALSGQVESWLKTCSSNSVIPVPALALLGGIEGVLVPRLFRGELSELDSLTDQLLAWIRSYSIPAGMRSGGFEYWSELGDFMRSLHPPVDRQLKPPAVPSDHRRRIVMALARECRLRGYAELSVERVVRRAAITRGTFYRYFPNKHQAFLAAQSFGLQKSIANSAAEFFASATWPQRVWGGLLALFLYTAGQPDLAHLGLIETYAAGPTAIQRALDNQMAYTIFLEEGYQFNRAAQQLPRIYSVAIAGAINALMRDRVSRGLTAEMAELVPIAAYISLAPFIGACPALDLVSECARETVARSL